MSTSSPSTRRRTRQRWVIPVLSVVIGVAYLIAGLVGGDRSFGVFGFLLMAGLAVAFLLLSHYSETVAGLMDRRDERINRIDSEATTIAGMAVIIAVIVAFVVEIAQGHDGSPYAMLGAIGGVAYVAALVVLRFRR